MTECSKCTLNFNTHEGTDVKTRSKIINILRRLCKFLRPPFIFNFVEQVINIFILCLRVVIKKFLVSRYAFDAAMLFLLYVYFLVFFCVCRSIGRLFVSSFQMCK